MYVYSYYNRKIEVYQDPIFQPIEKELFPKLVQRNVVLNPVDAAKNHLYECDLFFLGTYDETRGTFDLLEHPEFLCSLSHLEVKQDA